MSTEYRFSLDVCRMTARDALDELERARNDGLYSSADDRTERSPQFWVDRLSQALEYLLDATGPATADECDKIIKAAIAEKSRLLGAATAPVAGHPFVSPGLVAPDRPAPDACMECGQPRKPVHPDAGQDAGRLSPKRGEAGPLCSGELPHQSRRSGLAWNWKCTLGAGHAGPHEAGGSTQIGEPNVTWPRETAEQDTGRAIVADLNDQLTPIARPQHNDDGTDA